MSCPRACDAARLHLDADLGLASRPSPASKSSRAPLASPHRHAQQPALPSPPSRPRRTAGRAQRTGPGSACLVLCPPPYLRRPADPGQPGSQPGSRAARLAQGACPASTSSAHRDGIRAGQSPEERGNHCWILRALNRPHQQAISSPGCSVTNAAMHIAIASLAGSVGVALQHTVSPMGAPGQIDPVPRESRCAAPSRRTGRVLEFFSPPEPLADSAHPSASSRAYSTWSCWIFGVP